MPSRFLADPVTAPFPIEASPGTPHPTTRHDAHDDPLWLHLAVGLAQGGCAYGLTRVWCHDCSGGMASLLRVMLLYAALVVPTVWHLVSRRIGSAVRRAWISATIGLSIGGMAALSLAASSAGPGWRDAPLAPAGFNVPALLLVALLVPLVDSADLRGRRFVYRRWIDSIGRNVMVLFVAACLTALLWLLLGASGWLMRAIGIEAWLKLIGTAAFAVPFTSGAFGLAIGLALRRLDDWDALRRAAGAAVAPLLPVALAFLALWTATLPFTGLQVLMRTHDAAFYLLWFAALCVVFANAWFVVAGASPAVAPGRLPAAAWPLTLLLPALAGWALWQRIAQHGFTPERVWGVVAWGVLCVLVVGYSLLAWSRSHALQTVPGTNLIASITLVVAIASLITPVADARRLSAAHQVARLQAGVVSADAFDWNFLLHGTDRYGLEALQRLASATSTTPLAAVLANRASRELAAASNLDPGIAMTKRLEALWRGLVVRSTGLRADQGLLSVLAADPSRQDGTRCVAAMPHCLLWLVDLDGNAPPEALLIWQEGASVRCEMYARDARGWTWQGSYGRSARSLAQWLGDIDDGRATPTPGQWKDLSTPGQVLRLDR